MAAVYLFALMFWYHVPLTARLLVSPLLVLGVAGIAFGVGAVFAALTVTYRDFRYVIPFLTQVWMFVTPVIYPSSIVPERWRWLLSLNPMAGLIDGFRAAFLARPLDWTHLSLSLAVSALLFLCGASYFRAVERHFADII